jgi:hypothetical protein
MSDPQDLLYTNKFVSTNILSDSQLVKETEYYDRFKNYIDSNLTDEGAKYVENDIYESSSINVDKRLNTKWPIYSNKNHYPLFDNYTNDISSNRYKKEIITKLNVDSRSRNISLYPNPNSFKLPLSQVFNNVKKIVINDIVFKNTSQSVTNINNNLSWQYASSDYLYGNNIDLTIIPVPDADKTISYSSLPNSVYSYQTTSGSNANIDKYLVYQCEIPPGFYNISELINKIELNSSKILHGSNMENLNIVEQPYLAYPKRIGTPQLFTCSINPVDSIVRFVNRIEKVRISALQTFSPYETQFANVDIFYYYSSQYLENPSYVLSTKFIYVLVPAISDTTYQYYQNVNCIYTPNPFPLVITGLETIIGNISPDLINYTEFYDIQIYLQNGYTETQLSSVSYYKYVDTISFTNNVQSNYNTSVNIVSTYLRFALSLSTGNITGNNYNSNGQRIIPSDSKNFIFSYGLNKILTTYQNINVINSASGVLNPVDTTGTGTSDFNITYNNKTNTSGTIYEYYYIENQLSRIGRALLYRWIFDLRGETYITSEYDTYNEKKRSLLHILAWPIANETKQIYTSEQNNGFRFVHTNYQSQIVTKNTLNSYQVYYSNKYPSYSLNLQYFSNDYFFLTNNYVYLKIYFDSHENLENDSEYINSISGEATQYNQVYVDSSLFDIGIGQDYTCLSNSHYLTTYNKNYSYIFAKILLSDVPGNLNIIVSNIINNNSYYIYYDNVRDKIEDITVEVYDSDMKLLFNNSNFSFTIDIYEIKDILKETLVNTKNNDVVTTGHFI